MSNHCPQHAMHAALSPIRPRPPQRLLHHARLKYPPVEPATNGLRLQSDSTRPLTVLRMKLLLLPPVVRRPQPLNESITISSTYETLEPSCRSRAEVHCVSWVYWQACMRRADADQKRRLFQGFGDILARICYPPLFIGCVNRLISWRSDQAPPPPNHRVQTLA